MENQLPTQPKSSSLVEQKDKVTKFIKQNLNYIYIVLLIIANIILSVLSIEDGKIGLNYPHTALGWILWVVQILMQTLISVLILNAFRKQGINVGHIAIKETYDEYLKMMQKNKQIKPRSLRQYLTTNGVKDSVGKAIISIIVSIFVGSCIIGANFNNLLSLIVNAILSVCFGIMAMTEAEEFVIKELVLWYQLKIAEVTNHKEEPAEEINNE